MFRGRSLRTEPSRKTCSPGLRERRRGRCRGPCGLCNTPPGLEEAPDAARPPKCSSAKTRAWENAVTPRRCAAVPSELDKRRPTLSPARTLKEAMTWSAVSVSAVSRDMKSMKAWKVTMPILLGSTTLMMRENSLSPWWWKTGSVTLGSRGDQKKTPRAGLKGRRLRLQIKLPFPVGVVNHTHTSVHTCNHFTRL